MNHGSRFLFSAPESAEAAVSGEAAERGETLV
jgi:hypothetical protein